MPGGPGQGGDPSLVRLLAGWLPRQRWFGGKDSPIEDLSIGTATELRTGEPGLHHLVLDVRQSGATEHYQVLLGVRRDLPERLRSHEIGLLTGATGITGHAYDAAHDPELTRPLLAHMARESVIVAVLIVFATPHSYVEYVLRFVASRTSPTLPKPSSK